MSNPTRGLALAPRLYLPCRHSIPGFPTQWAIVLADSPLFEGRVWCGYAAETVNGWCASWTQCEWSPAAASSLNPPVTLFSDVVRIAQAPALMDSLQALVAERNFASELDRFYVYASNDIPYSSAKYGVLALWRLREGRYINFCSLDLKSLAKQIKGRFIVLQRLQPPVASHSYPVVPLENESGKAFLGRFNPPS